MQNEIYKKFEEKKYCFIFKNEKLVEIKLKKSIYQTV